MTHTQQVFNCDFASVADAIEADVIITDPPYSAHVHTAAVSQSKKKGVRKRELGFDCLTPRTRVALADVVSKARRWSVVYSDWEHIYYMMRDCQEAGATYIRTMPWVRWSMPQLSGDRPPSGSEALLLFWGWQKGKKRWNGPGNLTHMAHKCLRGAKKHKTEKPLDQCLDLVQWFSDETDLVFDPFAGSGTIGLACHLLGRNYIGCEIDPQWAEVAQDRCNGELRKWDPERIKRWLDSKALPSD